MLKRIALIISLCSVSLTTLAEQTAHSGHQIQDDQPILFTQLDASFELANHQGNSTKISDFQGQYLLIGFGFTNCTYVCPTMAANMAGALREAAKSNIEAMGVFISVDTERDSPKTTHAYAQAFAENIIGLSGSHNQVSRAAKNFKANFAITKTPNEYTVQHTANIYLINPNGAFIDSFAIGANPQAIAAAMR